MDVNSTHGGIGNGGFCTPEYKGTSELISLEGNKKDDISFILKWKL